MAKRGHLLLATVILLESSLSLSTVTIGLEGPPRPVVSETVGTVTLCASVTNSTTTLSEYVVNITITYQDRSAHGGLDYEETPNNFLITQDRQRHCFNVKILDDNNYEKREEFQVNLTTTDDRVVFAPKQIAVILDDNEVVTIGWEHASYTVGEGDGQFEVCAGLSGYLEDVVRKTSVRAIPGTAIIPDDFSFPDGAEVNFPKGSSSSNNTCFTIMLSKNIEYEEEKNFTIEIVPNGAERLILDPQITTIVITDYNVITKQRPRSVCEGINNLIMNSSMPDICSSEEDCDVLTCSTSDWGLVLSVDGCNREITLNVTDYDDEEVSETFSSQTYEQELNHTYKNQTGAIHLTSRVVPNEQKLFYLLTIESLLLNLSFPTTAIPVECPQEGTTPTTNSTTPGNLSSSVRLIVIISSSVGGAVLAILLVVAIILSVVCCVVIAKRRKKKTLNKKKSYW